MHMLALKIDLGYNQLFLKKGFIVLTLMYCTQSVHLTIDTKHFSENANSYTLNAVQVVAPHVI